MLCDSVGYNIPESTPAVINYKEIVKEKISKAVIEICKSALTILIQDRDASPEDFIERRVKPQQVEIASLDKRTNQFFHKVVGAADLQLGKTGSQGFEQLAEKTRIPDVRKKYIESCSLPFVKSLISDLDAVNPTLVDEIIEAPLSWEIKRSQAKLDFVIKVIAVAVFSAIAVTATVMATISGVLPLLLVKGVPLGSLCLGILGGIGTCLIKRSVEEGSLFGRFKQFFDLHLYFMPKVAKKVCEDLKTGSFRDLNVEYDFNNLCRYGLINQESLKAVQSLVQEVRQIDDDNRAWQLNHLKEVNFYKEDPEHAEAAVVRERKISSEAVELALEAKWKLLLNDSIMALLPEKEIDVALEKEHFQNKSIKFFLNPV